MYEFNRMEQFFGDLTEINHKYPGIHNRRSELS